MTRGEAIDRIIGSGPGRQVGYREEFQAPETLHGNGTAALGEWNA
jgi:hypothetical protein